jgi:outer membrane protein OmpU
MKKTFLLGTTALFAAGLVMGGVAQAAEEPITAGISGYFLSAIAGISEDNADGEFADASLSTAFDNSSEISVGGSTTFDNGITAGFNVQVDAAGFDERHAFFSGSFGQILVGQIEGARQQMTNFAPSVSSGGMGINSPHFFFGNGGIGGSFATVRTYNDNLGDEDSMKLVYFSPTFNGFRVGLSYAPDDVVNGGYARAATGALGALQNNASAGAEFSNNFGDVSVRVSAGIETYTLETCNVNAAGAPVVASINTTNPVNTTAILRTTADQNCDDNPTTVFFGGTASFGDFSIGGGHMESDQIGNTGTGTGRDRTDMDLAISYAPSGPMSFALQYGEANLDDAAGLTDSLEIYQLQATYVVGPGFDIGLNITKGEFDDATAGGADNDFTSIAITTALFF